MTKSRDILTIAIYLILASMPHVASAASITWQYQGKFTIVPNEFFQAGLKVGDTFLGEFSLDTHATDLSLSLEKRIYSIEDSFIEVPALGSRWNFKGKLNGAAITVMNDFLGLYSFFELYQRDTPLNEIQDPTKLTFFNGVAPKGLFPGSAAPSSLPDASAFTYLGLQYTDYSLSPFASAQGRVTNIKVVPENSPMLLMATGFICLAVRRGIDKRTSRKLGFLSDLF